MASVGIASSDSDEPDSSLQEPGKDLFAQKSLEYSTATGSYTSWNLNVNLSSPVPGAPKSKEDEYTIQYYDAFQYTLFEVGLPETEDRTSAPRTHYTKDDVTIAILSSPVECMAFLLEGSKQCSGDMLLVLSSGWVTKVPSRIPGLFSLYVHKAITCEFGGRTFIDVYQPPRRVTYLVNFFTDACTEGQRDDGDAIETGLDCPTSSSINLCKRTDDKLLTRILLAHAGVDYPETLAFAFKPEYNYNSGDHDIFVISLDTIENQEELLRQKIEEFCNKDCMDDFDKVVVKPSGRRWHGSMGVTFHYREKIDEICKAANELLQKLEAGDAVLVEAFYDTFKPLHPLRLGYKTTPARPIIVHRDLAIRVRSTVCRTPGDNAQMTQVICGVGLTENPVNGDNTCPQSLDSTLRDFGIMEPSERSTISDRIREMSEATMKAIIEHEKTLTLEERGNVGAQTDIIGIDLVLTRTQGMLCPVVIEVNAHDCTINCQIFEFINPNLQGSSVRPIVHTMIYRSQRYIMSGKRVLVVGAGGESKKYVWGAAREYGIEVILVESDANHFAAAEVEEFLHYDMTDHSQDDCHADNIMQILKKRNLSVDGCLTFWEDCVPLAALLVAKLGLPGSTYEAAMKAKMKSKTHQTLMTRQADIPHWPRTYLYASSTYHIEKREDIDAAVNEIGLPALLKLEFGSSAVGVKLMNSVKECQEYFDQIHKDLKKEKDHPGIGLGHNNSMLLMEFIDGTEHDVDIIISRGKMIMAFVSDNGPTHLPYFTETAAVMPSYLRDDKRNQLVVAAYQCCMELGLRHGVYNVEMKMTPRGPKLIEINARMGGFYLRDWVRQIYDVDLLFCAFVIACDIRLMLHPISPRCHIVGVMLVPSQHLRELENNMDHLKSMHNQGLIRLNMLDDENNLQVSKYEEPFCNVAVMDQNPEDAKQKLLSICKTLGFTSKKYPVPYFLGHFVRS